MATITLTIGNGTLTDLINAFGETYQATLPDGTPNPQTKVQFAKEQVRQMLKSQVIEYKKRQASPPADPDITIS